MADEREQNEGGTQDRQSSDAKLPDQPKIDSASRQGEASDPERSTSRPSGARATRVRGEPKNVSDEDPKP